MASPRRSIPDGSVSGAGDAVFWREHRLARPWSGAGHVGLSAVDHTGRGGSTPTQPARDPRELLAELIARHTTGDAIEISTKLFDRYGSLSGVMTAFRDGALGANIPDDTRRYLASLVQAFDATLRSSAVEGLMIGSPTALIDLLRHEMTPLTHEVFRIFFLDGRNRVLADREMWRGTVDGVQVHPREIIRAALDTGATALILTHNHPASSAHPSDGDIEITAQVLRACMPINVVLHDHLIIAADGSFSMRAAGILDTLERNEAIHRKTSLRACA